MRFHWIGDLFSDIRYAGRAFRRNPAFALTATACLALGIGANTTMFSIASEVMFSEPSVREPGTLLAVRLGGNSHAPLREYRFVRDSGIFNGIAGENEESEVNWRHGDAIDRLFVVRVTDNFFDVTGMPVALGRPLQTHDLHSVVLTYGFWQRRLGGDPNIVGRPMVLDGQPYTVAGVLPQGHRTVTGYGFAPDLYVPLSSENAIVALYARMPPGMTVPIAYQRLQATCEELDRVYPAGNFKWARDLQARPMGGVSRMTGSEFMTMAAFFAMLMVVVGLVLLIACANVASLLLARASSRAHELAIRLSIGAGRGRIIRQLLAESLLLAVCGTVAGLALNVGLTALLSRYPLPLPVPIQFTIRPDWRLLSYAAAIALATSLACGLAPAIKGTRAGLNLALKRGEHQTGRGRWTLRNALVVGQLAVSIVLLSAGFLFMRNLMQATSMSPGFDSAHTLWVYMRLAPEGYPVPEKIHALVENALQRLRNVPGVESAAIARVVPLNGNMHLSTRLFPDTGRQPVSVSFHDNYVSDGYFRTMGIPIVAGREFLPSDRRVAILNENLARRLFGNINPIGHTFRWAEGGAPVTVAGVAGNSKYFTLGEDNALAYYAPYIEMRDQLVNLNFLVRAEARPEPLMPGADAVLGELDPTAALETKPMAKALSFAMLPSRAGAAMLGSMGLLGLALASIGLYGVLLYAVSRRIREIGLRVALGAGPGSILRLVFEQSFGLVAAGLVIGTAVAIFAVRPLAMFLVPGVRPGDAWNFAAVAGVLCLVALAATASPALRALRVDPMVALREE
jgi:predicted permease